VKVYLKNDAAGIVKEVKVGFAWVTGLFGPLVFFFRGMPAQGFLHLILIPFTFSAITTLLVSTLSIVGCDLYTQYHPYGALSKSANAQAELNSERAALVRQYRECLEKKQADPQVSCSEYRIAIEVIKAPQ